MRPSAARWLRHFIAASPISSSFPQHRDLESNKESLGRHRLIRAHSPRIHFTFLSCITRANLFAIGNIRSRLLSGRPFQNVRILVWPDCTRDTKAKKALTPMAATKASFHEICAKVAVAHILKNGVTVVESRVARGVGSLTYRATLETASSSLSLPEVLRHRRVKSVKISRICYLNLERRTHQKHS